MDYIQRYMTEHPNSSCEDLKSKLNNIRFAVVNDSHHAFTMLCKARQTMSEAVQVYERLYALANDAFAKVYRGVVESQKSVYLLMVCFMITKE